MRTLRELNGKKVRVIIETEYISKYGSVMGKVEKIVVYKKVRSPHFLTLKDEIRIF